MSQPPTQNPGQPPTPAPPHAHVLPVGYKLQNYRILDVLGEGGFGVTYLAHDEVLDQKVAIKEYFPASLTNRDPSTKAVHTTNQDAQKIFQWGLDRFLSEARILAQLSHPNIVRVLFFTSLNNTGYMVMQYEEGEPLDRWVKRFPDSRLPEAEVRGLLEPISDALSVVHKLGIAHRDVKPANIYIRASGTPVLLDFGAARDTVSGKSKTVAAIVSSGYSPIEQYSDVADQGPWTDIYATAGVAYRMILGETPPDAPSRIDAEMSNRPDPCKKLVDEAPPGFDPSFLAGIDGALSIRANERPQSIAEWRRQLGFDADPNPVLEETVIFDRPAARPVPKGAGHLSGAKTASSQHTDVGQGQAATASASPDRPGASRNVAAIVGGLLVAALAGGGGWFIYQQQTGTQEDQIGETFDDAERLGTLTPTLKTVSDKLGGDDTKDVIRFKLARPRLVEVDTRDVPDDIEINLQPANGEALTPLKRDDKLAYLARPGDSALVLRSDSQKAKDYAVSLKALPLDPDTDDPDAKDRRPPFIDLDRSATVTRDGIIWKKGQERTYTVQADDTRNVTMSINANQNASLNLIDTNGLGLGRVDGGGPKRTVRMPAGENTLVVTSRQEAPLAFGFTLEAAQATRRQRVTARLDVPTYLTRDQATVAARNRARAQLVLGEEAAPSGDLDRQAKDLAAIERAIPYEETFETEWAEETTVVARLAARLRQLQAAQGFDAALSTKTIAALEPFDVTLTSTASKTLFAGIYAWGADGSIVRIFPIGQGNTSLALQPRATARLSDKVNRLVSAPLPGQRESNEAVIVTVCPTDGDFKGLAPAAGENVGESLSKAVNDTAFFDNLSQFCPQGLAVRVLPYTVVATGNPN